MRRHLEHALALQHQLAVCLQASRGQVSYDRISVSVGPPGISAVAVEMLAADDPRGRLPLAGAIREIGALDKRVVAIGVYEPDRVYSPADLENASRPAPGAPATAAAQVETVTTGSSQTATGPDGTSPTPRPRRPRSAATSTGA